MSFDRLRQLPRHEVTLGRLVRAAWRRAVAIPDDFAYRLWAGPGSDNYRRLTSMHNRHLGERCFVLGNGPSLSRSNLNRLGGQITFGLNRIFLMFDKTEFRPTYYACMNRLVLEQSADSIRVLAIPRFVNWTLRNLFDRDETCLFLQERFTPSFSTDLRRGVWGGATVTYVALQIAYFMGFAEVILLGVDHHYEAKGTPHSTVVGRGGEGDHFVPDYFPKGFRWQLPDLRTSEIAYRMARAAFEADGRRILDATLDGQLAVFPKIELERVT